ncbi:MAG: BolA/IbaG family iron-sulfur metabolism protein [Pseudomonadales bacterium]|nr:BolA/IbaG family iron-sulfur metabolism protein [Pseudomonadales bacterium]
MQETIVERVADGFPGASINVELDGNRATIEVTSEAFVGMSRVKKQQAVYACIQDFIADGTLHAVTIKAIEPDVRG